MSYKLNPLLPALFDIDNKRSETWLSARYLKLDGTNGPMIGPNSTTFFQIQQADTTPVFNVDTLTPEINTYANLDLGYNGLKKIYTNVLTVNNTGGADYATITAAIADAVSGDAIQIYPGTYTEAVMTIPDGVDLLGVDSGTVILGGPDGTRGPVWTFAGNNNVSNLSFYGSAFISGSGWNYSLVMVNGPATFTNCIFKHRVFEAVDYFIIDTPVAHVGEITLINCNLSSNSGGVSTSERFIYGIRFRSTNTSLYIYNTIINLIMAGNGSSYGVWMATFVGNSFLGSTINASKSGTGTVNYGIWTNSGIVTPLGCIVVGNIGPGGGTLPPKLGWGRFEEQSTGGTALQVDSGTTYLKDRLIIQGSSNEIQQIIKGAVGQGDNLTEWQNSTGIRLSGITKGGRPINGKSTYTNTATITDYHSHKCNSATAFTLTVTNGTYDGEEIVIRNVGAGTVTLSGNFGVTAVSTLLEAETISLEWDTSDGELQ